MSLADNLQALISESVGAANRMAELMRKEGKDRPASFTEHMVLNANVQGIENAIRALATEVEKLGSVRGADLQT